MSHPTAEDFLPSLIQSHLPPPPARLAVSGPAAGAGGAAAAEAEELRRALAERLEVAGYQVVERAVEGAGGPAAASDAVLLLAAGAPEADHLEALRRHLPEEGRLLLLNDVGEGPGAPPEERLEAARERTRRLYAAGFAILAEAVASEGGAGLPDGPALVGDDPAVDGPHLTVARRAEHRVRAYRPGDEAAILDLFATVFHHRRSLARWRWAYEDNPYGRHHVSLAVDPDSRPVAHYAGYPVRVWAAPGVLAPEAGSVPAIHVGDTMTAPGARRVGRRRTSLLTRTTNHFFAAFSRGRVAFNYGANVGKVQRFYRRAAGAHRLEDAPYRSRHLDGRPFAGAPGPLRRTLQGWRVERLPAPARSPERWGAGTPLAEELDDLWRRARAAYRMLVERDRRYLAWRYAAPDTAYHLWAVYRRRRLVGWGVFRHEIRGTGGEADERLVWGDALFDPGEARAPAALLAAVVAAPEHAGARRVEGWLCDRPGWWRRAVEELGFEARPEPEGLGLVYAPFTGDPAPALHRDFHYTKGDFDLF